MGRNTKYTGHRHLPSAKRKELTCPSRAPAFRRPRPLPSTKRKEHLPIPARSSIPPGPGICLLRRGKNTCPSRVPGPSIPPGPGICLLRRGKNTCPSPVQHSAWHRHLPSTKRKEHLPITGPSILPGPGLCLLGRGGKNACPSGPNICLLQRGKNTCPSGPQHCLLRRGKETCPFQARPGPSGLSTIPCPGLSIAFTKRKEDLTSRGPNTPHPAPQELFRPSPRASIRSISWLDQASIMRALGKEKSFSFCYQLSWGDSDNVVNVVYLAPPQPPRDSMA